MALDVESVVGGGVVERNFCAEPALLKRCSCAPVVGSADANSRPDCVSIARAHAGVRCPDRGPLRCMTASRYQPLSFRAILIAFVVAGVLVPLMRNVAAERVTRTPVASCS